MIRAVEPTKRYDEILALDRLSLDVPVGAVFGLLGPNGAGKTTFLRLVMGFVYPDEGRIDLGGLPAARIGYLPERAFYPPRFKVGDYLAIIGRLAGLRDAVLEQAVAQSLHQFGLAGAAGHRLSACSRGMLQRLGLAQALIGDPPLVLLDEPVLGLDPAAQRFMREQIVALQQSGKTVLLSSHHLDEVTRVCTHVAVLSQGRLVRSGALENILAPYSQVTIVTNSLPADLASRLKSLDSGIEVTDEEIKLVEGAVEHKTKVLRLLLGADVDILHLSEQHATLEDVYLEATGG